jgi:hypothetical protein
MTDLRAFARQQTEAAGLVWQSAALVLPRGRLVAPPPSPTEALGLSLMWLPEARGAVWSATLGGGGGVLAPSPIGALATLVSFLALTPTPVDRTRPALATLMAPRIDAWRVAFATAVAHTPPPRITPSDMAHLDFIVQAAIPATGPPLLYAWSVEVVRCVGVVFQHVPGAVVASGVRAVACVIATGSTAIARLLLPLLVPPADVLSETARAAWNDDADAMREHAYRVALPPVTWRHAGVAAIIARLCSQPPPPSEFTRVVLAHTGHAATRRRMLYACAIRINAFVLHAAKGEWHHADLVADMTGSYALSRDAALRDAAVDVFSTSAAVRALEPVRLWARDRLVARLMDMAGSALVLPPPPPLEPDGATELLSHLADCMSSLAMVSTSVPEYLASTWPFMERILGYFDATPVAAGGIHRDLLWPMCISHAAYAIVRVNDVVRLPNGGRFVSDAAWPVPWASDDLDASHSVWDTCAPCVAPPAVMIVFLRRDRFARLVAHPIFDRMCRLRGPFDPPASLTAWRAAVPAACILMRCTENAWRRDRPDVADAIVCNATANAEAMRPILAGGGGGILAFVLPPNGHTTRRRPTASNCALGALIACMPRAFAEVLFDCIVPTAAAAPNWDGLAHFVAALVVGALRATATNACTVADFLDRLARECPLPRDVHTARRITTDDIVRCVYENADVPVPCVGVTGAAFDRLIHAFACYTTYVGVTRAPDDPIVMYPLVHRLHAEVIDAFNVRVALEAAPVQTVDLDYVGVRTAAGIVNAIVHGLAIPDLIALVVSYLDPYAATCTSSWHTETEERTHGVTTRMHALISALVRRE